MSKPTGHSRKVSSSLRGVLAAGKSGSTDSVRVTRSGEVQVYVELKHFRPEYVTQLEALGLRVEGAAPPGFSLNQSNFFRFTFSAGGIPTGTYKLFVALFRNGALADNRIDNGDLIGVGFIDIVYSP